MEGRKAVHNCLNVTAPVIFLLIVLFFGAWVRFDGITQQGIGYGDNANYLREAGLWAMEYPPKFLGGSFYRPVSYFLQGMAIRMLGDNDYSIKMLHGVMDVSSIFLIFIIASLLVGHLWGGAISSLLYSFLPGVVKLTRSELLHAESTFFVLLSLLFFVLFSRRKTGTGKRRSVTFLLLFLSGLCSGLAANTHSDLAFLAPGYVLYLLIRYYDPSRKRESLKSVLILSSIFTLSFFTPYLLGFILFGASNVLRVFFNEVSTGTGQMTARVGRVATPAIFFNIFYQLLKYFFGKQFLFTGILLTGAVFIMIYRKVKKEKDTPRTYLPLILLLSYAFFYSCFLFTSPPSRVLMPLLPLAVIIIPLWFDKIFRRYPGNYSLIAFVGLFFILFLINPKVLPGKTASTVSKSLFRRVYDILGDDVDSKNKLLIAPVPIWDGRVFKLDIYFGRKNAVYLHELPPGKKYNAKALGRLLKKRKIRYIFVVKHVQKILLTPNYPLPGKCFHRWLRNENFHYSLEKDRAIVRQYIRSRGGILIKKNIGGELYRLTGEEGHE